MHNNKRKKRPDLSRLSDLRVVQRNLVYVTNLSLDVAKEEILRKSEYFGRFGKVIKVVVNKDKIYSGPQGPSVSCYITYSHPTEAQNAIKATEGTTVDGRLLRASFGTTKYCTYFLRGIRCPNSECMYLHQMGLEGDSFTKEDMAQGKHLLCMFPDSRSSTNGHNEHNNSIKASESQGIAPKNGDTTPTIWTSKVSALVSRSLNSSIDDEEFPPMDPQLRSNGRGRGEPPGQRQQKSQVIGGIPGKGRGRGQPYPQQYQYQQQQQQQQPQSEMQQQQKQQYEDYYAYEDDTEQNRENSGSRDSEEFLPNAYQPKPAGSPTKSNISAYSATATSGTTTNNNITGNAHKQLRTKPSLLRKPQHWRAKEPTEESANTTITTPSLSTTANSSALDTPLPTSTAIAPSATKVSSQTTPNSVPKLTKTSPVPLGQDSLSSGSTSSTHAYLPKPGVQVPSQQFHSPPQQQQHQQQQQLSPARHTRPNSANTSPRAMSDYSLDSSFVVPIPTSPLTISSSHSQPSTPQRQMRPRKLEFGEEESFGKNIPVTDPVPIRRLSDQPSAGARSLSSSVGSNVPSVIGSASTTPTHSDFQAYTMWSSSFSQPSSANTQNWDTQIWIQEQEKAIGGVKKAVRRLSLMEDDDMQNNPQQQQQTLRVPIMADRRQSLDESRFSDMSRERLSSETTSVLNFMDLFSDSKKFTSRALLKSEITNTHSEISRIPKQYEEGFEVDESDDERSRSLGLGLGMDIHVPRAPMDRQTTTAAAKSWGAYSSTSHAGDDIPFMPPIVAPKSFPNSLGDEPAFPLRARNGFMNSTLERGNNSYDWMKYGFDESFGINSGSRSVSTSESRKSSADSGNSSGPIAGLTSPSMLVTHTKPQSLIRSSDGDNSINANTPTAATTATAAAAAAATATTAATAATTAASATTNSGSSQNSILIAGQTEDHRILSSSLGATPSWSSRLSPRETQEQSQEQKLRLHQQQQQSQLQQTQQIQQTQPQKPLQLQPQQQPQSQQVQYVPPYPQQQPQSQPQQRNSQLQQKRPQQLQQQQQQPAKQQFAENIPQNEAENNSNYEEYDDNDTNNNDNNNIHYTHDGYHDTYNYDDAHSPNIPYNDNNSWGNGANSPGDAIYSNFIQYQQPLHHIQQQPQQLQQQQQQQQQSPQQQQQQVRAPHRQVWVQSVMPPMHPSYYPTYSWSPMTPQMMGPAVGYSPNAYAVPAPAPGVTNWLGGPAHHPPHVRPGSPNTGIHPSQQHNSNNHI